MATLILATVFGDYRSAVSKRNGTQNLNRLFISNIKIIISFAYEISQFYFFFHRSMAVCRIKLKPLVVVSYS
jgi:hypothetical protein